jgi:hypothetical protein
MENFVSLLVVAVCSMQIAAFALPTSVSKPVGDSDQQNGTHQHSGTDTPSSGTATEQRSASPGTEVRGSAQSASTSDKETSRTWSGVRSTGGGTGTSSSSGMAEDPPPSTSNSSTTRSGTK